MKTRSIKVLGLAGILFMAGCTTPVAHNTPSGKAEVTVDAPPDLIKPILVNAMTTAGFTISRDSNYQLAFDKPVSNLLMVALLGSRLNAQPNERITYTIAPLGPQQTRIVADIAIITNPASGFEQSTPSNNGPDSAAIQAMLEKLKPTTPSNRHMGIFFRANMIVGSVVSGMAASNAGIQVGDRIIAIDGQVVSNSQDVGSAVTKAAKDMTMTVERDGRRKDFILHFES